LSVFIAAAHQRLLVNRLMMIT